MADLGGVLGGPWNPLSVQMCTVLANYLLLQKTMDAIELYIKIHECQFQIEEELVESLRH